MSEPLPMKVYLEPLCSAKGEERRWSEDQWERCVDENCVLCSDDGASGCYVPLERFKTVQAVAFAARDFRAEICEDDPETPQPEMKCLDKALDAWEPIYVA